MESSSNYGKVCQLLSKLWIKIKLKENIYTKFVYFEYFNQSFNENKYIYFSVINLDNLDYWWISSKIDKQNNKYRSN